MQDYTVNLALFDFIPVALGSSALWLLARYMKPAGGAVYNTALIGAVCLIAGGLMKASWKLLYTSTGIDLVFMNKQLFFFLASGFILLGTASYCYRRSLRLTPLPMAATYGVALALCAWALMQTLADQRTGLLVLLAVLTLGNLFLLTNVGMIARTNKVHWIIPLLLVNIAGTFVLAGIGRIAEQTAALQWSAEIVNTVAQGALLWAVLRLRRSQTSA